MRALNIIFAVLASILLPLQAKAFEDVRTPIVVAVQSGAYDLYFEAAESLYEGLSRGLNDHAVEFKEVDVEKLRSGEAADYDFLFSSAPVFAALQHYAGFSAVASLTDDLASNPEHDRAAVVLVRSKDGFKTLGDLDGARIGICSAGDSEIRFFLSEEFHLRGMGSDKTERIIPLGVDDQTACLAMFAEFEDFGALAVGSSRSLDAVELDELGLKVLEPRLNDDLKLVHTTSTYPGWVFSAGFKTSRELQNRVGALMRASDAGPNSRWTAPADVRALHSALQRSDAFYSSFSPKSFSDYVSEYRTILVGVCVAVLAAVLHMMRTSHLLLVRTRELTRSNELRIEGERRFHLLEKQNIVGQISSIVAHEIRQPLAALSNYAMALRRRSENGSLNQESLDYGLRRMVEESARANEIVGYVQKYVSGMRKSKEWLDLSEEIAASAASHASSSGEALVDASGCGKVRYFMDKMDLRLIVENLVKNALEASRSPGGGRVQISCGMLEDSGVFIKVIDFGPKLSDEEFARLSAPLNSSKTGGLGLGVSIVRLIAESYGGHLEFARREPSGICASVMLPSIHEKEGERS